MKLLTFGDSWTAGHGVEEDERYRNDGNPQYDKGFVMRLRNSNAWPRWLSDKLGCSFVNSGYCGYNNHEILNEIKDKDKIHFHVNISTIKLVELYNQAKLTFIPLMDSTANNTINESLACGTLF